jgi:hypothetical protein
VCKGAGLGAFLERPESGIESLRKYYATTRPGPGCRAKTKELRSFESDKAIK